MYRAVIFDVDGTLVDSNDAHAWAWIQALAEGGRHVDFARVRPLIGKGGDKLLPELAGISIESPEGQVIGDAAGASSSASSFLASTRHAVHSSCWSGCATSG